MAPHVSVVIPTHNRCALLRDAVASVQRQTFEDWGLIIVDDASTDGTADWVSSLTRQERRIRTVHLDSHSERAEARNRGLEEVSADLVLFLDDDDRLVPRGLERLARALDRQPRAALGIGARCEFDNRGHRRRAHHVRVPFTRQLWPEMLAGWYATPGQCMIRTAILREAGGWKANLIGAEDQELQLRLSRLGPAVFIPGTVLEYRVHDGQWRSRDADAVAEEIHQQFVASLAGAPRELAVRLREARRILDVDAFAPYHEGRYSKASRGYLRAVRTAPEMLLSPLTGPPLAGVLAKATAARLLGPRVASLARRTLRAGRRLRRRNPGGDTTKAVRPFSARRE